MIVVVLGQDCADHLRMSLPPLKGATIIYLDGGSADESREVARQAGANVIEHEYRQDDPLMNGRQRNVYLDYVKKHHMGEWVLALDADEVLDDLTRLEAWVKAQDSAPVAPLVSVHMRHLVRDLAHEDASLERHYVPHRLFKVSDDLTYPLGEHVVLQGQKRPSTRCEAVTIWHLAYADMRGLKRRYQKHVLHSNIHTSSYLRRWYFSHLFGDYPTKAFDPAELPRSVQSFYGVEPDELYFRNRGLELKHFIDAIHWRDHFKPSSAADFGAGLGHRTYALISVGVPTVGFEKSGWACLHSPVPLGQTDLSTPLTFKQTFDLIIAYDVLEHLSPDELGTALANLRRACKHHLLVSVPFTGDPNLEADPTHQTKKPRSWWVRQIEAAGFKESPVPEHFLYRHQLMIFEVTT